MPAPVRLWRKGDKGSSIVGRAKHQINPAQPASHLRGPCDDVSVKVSVRNQRCCVCRSALVWEPMDIRDAAADPEHRHARKRGVKSLSAGPFLPDVDDGELFALPLLHGRRVSGVIAARLEEPAPRVTADEGLIGNRSGRYGTENVEQSQKHHTDCGDSPGGPTPRTERTHE